MKAGNAGAIILLGVGVLLLNLAYTGRAAAVWSALRSGDAPAADTDTTAADASATGTGDSGSGTEGQGDDPTQTAPDQPKTLTAQPNGRAGYGAGWRTVRIN